MKILSEFVSDNLRMKLEFKKFENSSLCEQTINSRVETRTIEIEKIT